MSIFGPHLPPPIPLPPHLFNKYLLSICSESVRHTEAIALKRGDPHPRGLPCGLGRQSTSQISKIRSMSEGDCAKESFKQERVTGSVEEGFPF